MVEDGRNSYEFLRSDGVLANVYKRDKYYNIERIGGRRFGLSMDEALCLKSVLTGLTRQ